MMGADSVEERSQHNEDIQPDFTESNFVMAELSGMDLRWVDLSMSELRGANIRGADLTGAELYGADSRP